MIEDFDDDGNLKSSLPVIFLAEIWTPTVSYIQVSTEAPDTPAIEYCSDGYHVDPADCTSYFICLNGYRFPTESFKKLFARLFAYGIAGARTAGQRPFASEQYEFENFRKAKMSVRFDF